MSWTLLLLVAALALIAVRIYSKLRLAGKSRAESWDEQMIGRLRSQGYAPFNDYRVDFFLALPYEAAEAITRRQATHQDQLLAEDPVGREIARLEAEKDRLLDTVWLAASPAQIKQLWTKVGELLGDEPTTLEREALAIEPPKEA